MNTRVPLETYGTQQRWGTLSGRVVSQVSLVVAVARVDLPEGEDDLSERRLHRRAPVHDVGAVVEDAVVVAQPDDRRVGRVERRELLTSRVEEGERPDLSVLEVHLSSGSSSITTAPEGGRGRART